MGSEENADKVQNWSHSTLSKSDWEPFQTKEQQRIGSKS